jgi:hypothetical protein
MLGKRGGRRMRGNAIRRRNRCIGSRDTESGGNRDVVARRRFAQIRVVEALATGEPFVGIELEKITNAVYQRDRNRFIKE